MGPGGPERTRNAACDAATRADSWPAIAARQVSARLAGSLVAQSNDFVFYSQFLALKLCDAEVVWVGAVVFFFNLFIERRVLGTKGFDMFVDRHAIPPFSFAVTVW